MDSQSLDFDVLCVCSPVHLVLHRVRYDVQKIKDVDYMDQRRTHFFPCTYLRCIHIHLPVLAKIDQTTVMISVKKSMIYSSSH